MGQHNRDLAGATARLMRGQSYRDCSTVCLIPTRGGRSLHPLVVQSWMGMMTPMNQKFTRIFLTDMEVGDAYSQGVEAIRAHPELRKWKYVLTIEDDNIVPPDGLLLLLETIQDYDVAGGLYWTKGPGGQPMAYGDPADMPRHFRPQIPRAGEVMPVCGTGMGFTLYRMKMLLDERLPRPIFKTIQSYTPQVGQRAYTQDLAASESFLNLGYKLAVDCRVLVGHMDVDGICDPPGLVW